MFLSLFIFYVQRDIRAIHIHKTRLKHACITVVFFSKWIISTQSSRYEFIFESRAKKWVYVKSYFALYSSWICNLTQGKCNVMCAPVVSCPASVCSSVVNNMKHCISLLCFLDTGRMPYTLDARPSLHPNAVRVYDWHLHIYVKKLSFWQTPVSNKCSWKFFVSPKPLNINMPITINMVLGNYSLEVSNKYNNFVITPFGKYL